MGDQAVGFFGEVEGVFAGVGFAVVGIGEVGFDEFHNGGGSFFEFVADFAGSCAGVFCDQKEDFELFEGEFGVEDACGLEEGEEFGEVFVAGERGFGRFFFFSDRSFWFWGAGGPGGAEGFEFGEAIHGEVGEFVGAFVFFAVDVGDGDVAEVGDEFSRLLIEREEVGAFDFVLAVDLADEEFGIGEDFEGGSAEGLGGG